MTNEELKKKIAQIIADYFCPQGNEHKKLWGDDRLCYSKMNFAECEWVTECTDALIAAGIGDVKETEAEANRYEMLYKMQSRDMVLAERKVYEAERKVHEAEHRAARAERALQIADELGELCGRKEDYVQQAEKELAEEGKDD